MRRVSSVLNLSIPFFFRVQLMIKEMMFVFGTLFVHPQWRVRISYGKVIQAHGNTLIM